MGQSTDIKQAIKKGMNRAFRRAYIKRRSADTGLFESTWQEITTDVKKWGTLKQSVDFDRPYKFRFSNLQLVMNNERGKYSPESDPNSLWYGLGPQQRTLVRIDCGFQEWTLPSSGVWDRNELPSSAIWDESEFDESDEWDGSSTQFIGVIAGDINLSDSNDIAIRAAPLTKVFEDFPASLLTNYTSTGMTSGQFITMMRDQTDGSGSFVFRPFFDNTTSMWNFTTTGVNYSQLNTQTADLVRDASCWDILETLAEAENHIPYISNNGTFNFVSRDPSSTVSFEFFGRGFFNTEYGHTIKEINSYGLRMSRYYSRVRIKFAEAETSTSYVTEESSFQVNARNIPWNYGHRTLLIDNPLIGTTLAANSLASSIFNDVSSLENEIDFSCSFIPHLQINQIFNISYDSSTKPNLNNLWDVNNWATSTVSELIWDNSKGQSIYLNDVEIRALGIELDLDKLETRIQARET